jgi:hypothetical protein
MIARVAKALAVAALLAAGAPAARADVPPLPLVNYRETTPHVRFDNLDDYPDWVFYLEYERYSGGPTGKNLSIVRLTTGEPVPFAGEGSRVRAGLVAVPRHFAEAVQAGPVGQPHSLDVPGALRAPI